MKIYYDKVNNACAVLFDKDDTVFMYQTEERLEVHSCAGGEPVIEEKILLVSIDELSNDEFTTKAVK